MQSKTKVFNWSEDADLWSWVNPAGAPVTNTDNHCNYGVPVPLPDGTGWASIFKNGVPHETHVKATLRQSGLSGDLLPHIPGQTIRGMKMTAAGYSYATFGAGSNITIGPGVLSIDGGASATVLTPVVITEQPACFPITSGPLISLDPTLVDPLATVTLDLTIDFLGPTAGDTDVMQENLWSIQLTTLSSYVKPTLP